jgi:hypothetical protein
VTASVRTGLLVQRGVFVQGAQEVAETVHEQDACGCSDAGPGQAVGRRFRKGCSMRYEPIPATAFIGRGVLAGLAGTSS